jgi:hypothetical protein
MCVFFKCWLCGYCCCIDVIVFNVGGDFPPASILSSQKYNGLPSIIYYLKAILVDSPGDLSYIS